MESDGDPAPRSDRKGGPLLCHAPFTSLRFDPGGWATVCAANQSQRLGNVADRTLEEMWTGPEATALRSQLGSDSYGSGCRLCRWQEQTSGRATSYARLYDRFHPAPEPPDSEHPEYPVHLKFSLSNRCNLQCVMCNGGLSSAIRTRREGLPPLKTAYGDSFFEQISDWLPHAEQIKFLGGEPFLANEHHRIWSMMIGAGLSTTDCHITTNGTIWNDAVVRVLDNLTVSFAISMDGIRPDTVAAIRVGTSLDQVLTNLDRFQEYAETAGTYLGLTFCLMRQNWREFFEFLLFADRRDLPVFVNTVLTPRRFSLYRLPTAESPRWWKGSRPAPPTRADRSSATLPSGTIRWRWLRGELRRRVVGRVSASDVVVPASIRPKSHRAARELEALRRWSGAEPVVVELDRGGELVCAVRGSRTLAGLDLGRSVGMGSDEVNVLLRSAFGVVSSAANDTLSPTGGGFDASVSFETSSQTTEVRSIVLKPTSAGHRRVALAAVAQSAFPGLHPGCGPRGG